MPGCRAATRLCVLDSLINYSTIYLPTVRPIGDEYPDITLAESMIEAITELRKSSPKEEL